LFNLFLLLCFSTVQTMLSAEHHMVCGWLFEWEIMHGRVDIIWPNTRNGAMVDALFPEWFFLWFVLLFYGHPHAL
jgi:hypothetical protein